MARSCRVCKGSFTPRNTLQRVCGVTCAISMARQAAQRRVKAKERESRSERRKARERLVTRREWVQRAQKVFNQFIRLRDRHRPCICCDRPLAQGPVGLTGGSYDAGHYRSVGSAPNLRFNESNVHAQRKDCNRFASGRAVDYRIGLIKRIGLQQVEALEADNAPRRYSVDDLKDIVRIYTAKARELKEQQAQRE